MGTSYNGKVLHVDLTDRSIRVEEPGEVFYRTYLGGRNIIGYYLLAHLPEKTEPLSPGNLLVFAASVLTGLPVGGLGRHSVGSKSPVTGGWADSEVGGFWGTELKAAGYDAIVIRGRAETPVYLWIHDGAVEIRDAGHVWGRITGETESVIREELGDANVRIAQIGPGGERLVQFACIIEDLHFAAGRNGLGAVMGSKNLKAVAVRGTNRPVGAKPDIVAKYAKKVASGWKENRERLGVHGTASGAIALHGAGQLPTRNFQEDVFDGTERITGQTMTDTILTGRDGCFACAVRCKRVVETEYLGRKAEPAYGGPEYETVGAFGSNLGIDDLSSIAAANAICNAWGVDTISAGMSIAFLIECFEKGIIDSSRTDGLELRFGDPELALILLEKLVLREGIGDVLAGGVSAALDYVGPAGSACALHVKGQYVPMHDPRGKPGVGLGYAFAPGGADHLQASHDPNFAAAGKVLEEINPLGIYEPMDSLSLGPEKVRFYYRSHLWISVLNVLDICWYIASPPSVLKQEEIVELVQGATGWNISLWELMKAGERGLQMARLFNTRNGIGPEQDILPDRFFTPIAAGPLAGRRIDRDEFLAARKAYYEMMSWDPETGEPAGGRLTDLGLEWAVRPG